jgi:hypothetical protein
MCSHVMPIATLTREPAGPSLQESYIKAAEYRERVDGRQVVDDLARDFVTRSEFQELTGHLDKLQMLMAETSGNGSAS